MTDDYICSVCGHRAGDHAVSNRCINDCDCKDDPYLEQLTALQAKLAIALEAVKVAKKKLGDYGFNTAIAEIDVALAKLEAVK